MVLTWQTSVVYINAYIEDRFSWIHDAYPNSQVINVMNNLATEIGTDYSANNHSRFRIILLNRLNAELPDQPARTAPFPE